MTDVRSMDDGPTGAVPGGKVDRTPSPGRADDARDVVERYVAPAGFAVGILALAVVAIRMGRGLFFAIDEWNIIAGHHDGHYLVPYNGHLSLVPIAIYRVLFATVGIGAYRPYALVALGIYLAIPVAMYLTHRSLVGATVAAVGALAVAWSWAAQRNLIYAFLMNFDIPVLMLVIAWWLIRTGERRRDLLAAAAVTVALASSSIGVIVAFAIGLELLLRRAALRRLALFIPPVVAWAVWYAFRHEPTKPATLGARASYAWHVAVSILAGFTFGWRPGAIVVAIGLVALLLVAWRRWGTLDAHVVATLAATALFVLVSAYSRAGDIALNPPNAARYTWIGDLLLIAVVLGCLRGRRVPLTASLAALAIVVIGSVGLVGHLRDFHGYLLGYGERTRPFLVAAEAAGPLADRNRDMPLNLIPVTVGEYLDAVHHLGSPVAGIPFDRLGTAASRRAADGWLIADEHVSTTPTDGAPHCASGGVRTGGGPSAVTVRLAPGAEAFVTAGPGQPAAVKVRRLAPAGAATTIGQVPAGTTASLLVPVDQSSRPWWLEVRRADTILVCPSKGPS